MGVTKQQLLNTVRQLKEYIDYTSGTSNLANYLAKTNTTEYTPTEDYHPATKKYVDDSAPKISTEENNAIEQKEDGLFVPTVGETKVSTEEGNAIIKKEDGIYVPSIAETHISAEDNNAITKKEDGIYVEDQSKIVSALDAQIQSIQKYKKFLNTELDYCYCTMAGQTYTPAVNEFVPWVKQSGNLAVTDGKFIVKSKQTVQITCAIGYQSSNSTEHGNISFSVRNETQNKVITNYYPHQGDTVNEHPNVLTLIYTNDSDEDNELGIYTYAVWTEDVISPYSYLIVQETNREVVIDPVEHVNIDSGLEDTPVGHIMSFMGINAPKHYLICDGTEYKIEKYPYLAQHFHNELGAINYFGGDGTTTFAVPNLTGDFLKGAITNIGVHETNIGTESWGTPVEYQSTEESEEEPENPSTSLTNMTILYCIKYEPTYFIQATGAMMNTTVLYDQEITKTGEYTLNDDANNYSAIIVEHVYTGGNTYQSDFVFPKFDGAITYEMGGATAYLYFTITNNIFAVTKTSSEKITKIIGIKEVQATNSSGGGGQSSDLNLTDEEIENLVNEAYNEAIKEIEGEIV